MPKFVAPLYFSQPCLISYGCSRRARATVAERDALAQDTEAAEQKKAAALEARKQQSHDMVAESIKRELAESTLYFPALHRHV